MKMRSLLILVVGLLAGAAAADDWPQWRGPNRDDLSKEKGLLQKWPEKGPQLLWQYKDAGYGFSGVAIVGDVLYTMGARAEGNKEFEYALALNIKGDKAPTQLWAVKLGPIFTFPTNGWGDGPRATPTVDGDQIYFLGGQGELVCLKRDGKEVWRKNLITSFGGQVMELNAGLNWGYCESPLVDGDKLICCPGGPKGWMLALDKNTGKQLWRTDKLTDQATDSSVVVATIGGVRQYINSTFKGDTKEGGIAGVDAATGAVLWFARQNYSGQTHTVYAVCPTPVVLDNLVYVSAGYKVGCNLFEITKDAGGKFSAKDKYDKKAQKVMPNDHGGVVLVDGHIYGYSDPLGWVCQDLKTGKVVWQESDKLDGKGSLTYADGRLYLFSDRGEACLIEATPKGWTEKGRFELPELSPSHQNRPTHGSAGVWTHPVVANGRLYLRDQEFLYCYKVR